MARVGGRSAWIAWPAGVVCAVIVAGLFWLAAPGIPAAIGFIGDTLRGATTPREETAARGRQTDGPATDCRGLYPDRLWAELTWTPGVLLSPSAAAPATETGLVQALTPAVRFTCVWTAEGGKTISTTLADAPGDAAAIAHAALAAAGFACEVEGGRVHCERTAGAVVEIHDLEGAVWLSSVLTAWEPEEYGAQTASRAFPR